MKNNIIKYNQSSVVEKLPIIALELGLTQEYVQEMMESHNLNEIQFGLLGVLNDEKKMSVPKANALLYCGHSVSDIVNLAETKYRLEGESNLNLTYTQLLKVAETFNVGLDDGLIRIVNDLADRAVELSGTSKYEPKATLNYLIKVKEDLLIDDDFYSIDEKEEF